MPNLSEELNVNPKRRVTIPEGYLAVAMTIEFSQKVKALCFQIRKSRRLSNDEKTEMFNTAGTLLLALVEAENVSI